MAEHVKPRTHKAFAFRREGKKPRQGRWLEVGEARFEKDGIAHVFLDRLPIGGFTGYVYLSPMGTKPPVPELQPERPGQDGDGGDQEETEI
jgi:hypothetical protein